MKKTAGLWIDHEKAVIVLLAGSDAETKLVTAGTEMPQRQSGAATQVDDIRQRESKEELSDYFDDVIFCIRAAEEILIFGPGEAKDELRKRLEKDHLGRRIVGVEASDQMTDLQTVAKVRKHFLNGGEFRPANSIG